MSRRNGNTYYFWLCDLILDRKHRNYNILIKSLHEKIFYWSVPNDDNRAFEGKNLREKFCEEEGIFYDFDNFEDDVSMLELLIALAFRCDSIMVDSIDSVSISEWFWRLLENVKLDKFTDEDFHNLGGRPTVNQILNTIIDRTYGRNGKGGLFPLQKSKKDQRKVELWYQMCQYLVENYYIEDILV